MQKRGIIAALLFSLGQALSAQSLELPPRPATAPKGTEFARSIADLSLPDREQKVLEAVKSGNVPSFLRKLVPVTVKSGPISATYFVAPDYLAIGSDDDFFLTPLSPRTAQAIADWLKCSLPTTKMVDDIYASATVKLAPAPIPPSAAMTTVPIFLHHNAMVLAQRAQKPSAGLVAGHKKDVVIASKVFATPGKVAIYGWHKTDGKAIQPLYTGHTTAWVDYSHGIRLVQRRMTVNGQAKTIDEVLADPRFAPLLSRDGVMRESRYPVKDGSAKVRTKFRASDLFLAGIGDDNQQNLSRDWGVQVVVFSVDRGASHVHATRRPCRRCHPPRGPQRLSFVRFFDQRC
jgi:hypothetical protein